jgi:enoyl-[acyl-carrier protein] reductase III
MVNEFSTPQQYALILGGSSGLGLATAQKLAAHGMGVIIVHRNTRVEMKAVTEAFQSIKDMGFPFHAFNIDILDKGKRSDLISFLKDYNIKIGCLVHSIAKGSLKAMSEEDMSYLTAEDINFTLQYMAISLFDWVMDLHQAHVFEEDTRITAFTSEGSQKAWKYYGAVSAAKSALEAIIRNIALELAPYGIRANCIQAGITPTLSMQRIPGSDILMTHTMQRNPFKRMTTPEDVANVTYLLCKPEAAWINGSIIPVDGGEHIS